MKNDLNNLVKTLCCRLRFLWLHETFVRFLQPVQNPCNTLIYNNMGGGGVNPSVKINSRKFTPKTFYLQAKMIRFIYSKTGYY
ncbi:MAG: hypothetical protein LBK94_11420 [Prevotellaceae bacterium]|jgi:hypothetical protein|nr:hypothetical protein [Prevotellaceae bacterium]